jgi:peptidoglycan-N-acetylglucosamine deacetylase
VPALARRSMAVLAALLLLAGGCTSPHPVTLLTPNPAPSSAAPSPLALPSASASPSAVPPSPSRSPSKKPTPPTVQPASGPLSCKGSVKLARSPVTGSGPAGSLRSTGTPAVALTFDDGPDPINTPKLLDMLKQCGVKATFCLVGFRARDRPELVRRIVAEGHTVCNHSWQHLLDLGAQTRTDEYIKHDLRATTDAIRKAAPNAKVAYFRAPGGNFTPRLVKIAADLGMKSIYWSLDPRDWEKTVYGTGSSMVNHVISAVENGTRPGAIVLSHDNGKPDTITAYRTLLPWLKARFKLIALPTALP